MSREQFAHVSKNSTLIRVAHLIAMESWLSLTLIREWNGMEWNGMATYDENLQRQVPICIPINHTKFNADSAILNIGIGDCAESPGADVRGSGRWSLS